MTLAHTLLQASDNFYRLVSRGQSTDYDNSLVDSVRKTYGPRITQDAGQFLNSKAVSSIPIRVKYARPAVNFIVTAVGQDAEIVNKELGDLLNKKYAAGVAGILAKAKESNFEFGLLTVE